MVNVAKGTQFFAALGKLEDLVAGKKGDDGQVVCATCQHYVLDPNRHGPPRYCRAHGTELDPEDLDRTACDVWEAAEQPKRTGNLIRKGSW